MLHDKDEARAQQSRCATDCQACNSADRACSLLMCTCRSLRPSMPGAERPAIASSFSSRRPPFAVTGVRLTGGAGAAPEMFCRHSHSQHPSPDLEGGHGCVVLHSRILGRTLHGFTAWHEPSLGLFQPGAPATAAPSPTCALARLTFWTPGTPLSTCCTAATRVAFCWAVSGACRAGLFRFSVASTDTMPAGAGAGGGTCTTPTTAGAGAGTGSGGGASTCGGRSQTRSWSPNMAGWA